MKRFAAAAIFAALSSASHAETITIGDYQRQVMAIVQEYAGLYAHAPNELKKSGLVRKRLEAIGSLKGNTRKIEDWYGSIDALGTNRDGDAYVSVELPVEGLKVGTWNNALSDVGAESMIKNGSPLYEVLSEMSVGDIVKFSGSLGKPKNMTENGSMTAPEFLFKFSKIEKVSATAWK